MIGDPTSSTVILASDPTMTVRSFSWSATQASKPAAKP
jgi:hypothetical protein